VSTAVAFMRGWGIDVVEWSLFSAQILFFACFGHEEETKKVSNFVLIASYFS